MNSRKLVFLIFTVIFVMSCQKDDGELPEIEQVESINSKSYKPVSNKPALKCDYVSIDAKILSGSYTSCELYDKMNELKLKLSQKTDPRTGCAIYNIPETNYFDCNLMNEPFYIEQWKVLGSYYCGGNYPCVDAAGNPMEPDSNFPMERDDD